MNQGRIWTVVKPTVGLPLLLGSVTVIALGVHYAVLSHTTWFSAYWQGKSAKTALTSETSPVALNAQPGFTVSVAPSAASDKGVTSFVVTVTPAAPSPVAVDTSTSRPPDKVASVASETR
jgi:light-harvesting protein B-800-850 alpha chain